MKSEPFFNGLFALVYLIIKSFNIFNYIPAKNIKVSYFLINNIMFIIGSLATTATVKIKEEI